jgi:hypothetical protein
MSFGVKGLRLSGAETLRRIGAQQLVPAERRTRKPKLWEVELLALIAEQQAIPFDQLARFLDCGEAEAAQVAMYLVHCGYAEYGRLLVGEPPWVWLTNGGSRRSRTGFAKYGLRVGAMPRMRAVNETRLFLAARVPEGEWTSYRALLSAQGPRGYRPNGVVGVGKERHAIVVKLGVQLEEREVNPIEAFRADYDAVIVFAKPEPRRFIERLAANRHWSRLVIRDLPTPESR